MNRVQLTRSQLVAILSISLDHKLEGVEREGENCKRTIAEKRREWKRLNVIAYQTLGETLHYPAAISTFISVKTRNDVFTHLSEM